MFYPFNYFHKPRDFVLARTTLLEWLRSGKAFFSLGLPANIEPRKLSEAELNQVEGWIDDDWQGSAFGGYSVSQTDAKNEGYCHFVLENEQTEASLSSLIVEQTSDPAGRNIVQTALKAMLNEHPQLERLSLPDIYRNDTAALLAILGENHPPESWTVETSAGRLELSRTDFEEAQEEPAEADSRSKIENGVGGWLELSVRAVPEAVEPITELFARYGYNQGVVIEEAVEPGPDGGALIDPTAPVTIRTYISTTDQAALGQLEKVRQGLFYLGRLLPIEDLQVAERREEDWANAWKEFYQVHRVGRRSVIKPPWQEYTALPDDIVIEIDPGMAFGTGLHPTTRLCLQLMEDQLDPAIHQKVLDLGTGSGILAIAAARLGVPYILGLDTDPVAVQSAKENVERNGLTGQIVMETGSLAIEENISGEGGFYAFSAEAQRPPDELARSLPFDGIIANIIARILIALAEPMTAALKPGGLLITSGIIGERADEVDAALQKAGLERVERLEESDWVAFAHRRPLAWV